MIREELENTRLIKYNMKEKIGFYVTQDRKVKGFRFEELEDPEVLSYIIENGEEETSSYDIEKCTRGEIFEYTIHNGGEYELAEYTTLHSLQYFTREEFQKMIDKAIQTSTDSQPKDVYYVYKQMKKLYPNIFLEIARGTGACTCEWKCGHCSK